MICPSRCSSFKMDCELLHQAWKENEKLTTKNWKLTADISDLKLRLSDSKILHKVNMKDKKSELNVMLHENKKLTKEVVRLQAKLDQEFQNREKEQIKKDSKISALKQQNEKLKAKSQSKFKNDQELDAKNRKIDKLEKTKQECPICIEPISIDRKWTAFIPCGHRTCSECADKISSLPRSTNKRKCPNCRENIIGFLVLEGIYES